MHFARDVKANCVFRGLRAVSDFDFEFQMAGMNAKLDPEIDTVFLMAADKWQFVSSSFVKEIYELGGDVSEVVTPAVQARLKAKFSH
jgi:pantetheine-phosphate adenylyltransferase